MCYFDQTRWACGFWRWGHFRQQCNKEYRMGETCGLKLVYETRAEMDVCKLCHDREKKQRRYDKMSRDVQRWQREGNRSATIERTCGEMQEVWMQIQNMYQEHDKRVQSVTQVRDRSPSEESNWRVSAAKQTPWLTSACSSDENLFEAAHRTRETYDSDHLAAASGYATGHRPQ